VHAFTGPDTGARGVVSPGLSQRGWWCDMRWTNRHLRPGAARTLALLCENPAAWHQRWHTRGVDDARWRAATGLTAEETCDVIDHQVSGAAERDEGG
jgi:hypothetical protein